VCGSGALKVRTANDLSRELSFVRKDIFRQHQNLCDYFVNFEDLQSVFEDAHKNRICVRLFAGVNVRALCVSELYYVIAKNNKRTFV